MKKMHYTLAIMLMTGIMATAQTCTDITATKGQVLTFKREMVPMQKKDVNYFKMKKKEQEAEDEKYKMDLASGNILPTRDYIVSTLEDIEATPEVTRYIYSSLIKGATYKTKNICGGSVMIFAPYQDMTETSTPLGDGRVMTSRQFNGYNKIPRTLHVGDTVPSYQNVSFTTPVRTTIQSWVSHTEKDMNGDVWKISELKTNTMDISSSTVTKYVNREVMAEEDLVISGKTYKAYKINTEMWTKFAMKGDVTSVGLALSFAVVNKIIDKKTNKAVGANKEGFLVTSTNDGFIPALGVIGKTEVFDQNGNRTTLITLEDIK